MKQKIVIRISMLHDKCRSKALKIAVCIPGAESAAVEGEEKDQVVVVGDGVDSVELARRLRKKMGRAELLSVGAADSEQPTPPAVTQEPVAPAEGVVASPFFGFPPHHHHYFEVREPTCDSPCAIL